MTRFDGRVALVSGAGSGIGASVAELLAAQGAAVGVFDVDGDAARETAAAIEDGGGRALALAGDARSEADVAGAVAATVKAFGGLDLLAPLAGVLRSMETAQASLEEWDFVLDTNLKGPFLFVRAAIPHLRARGGGSIVLAGSVMAYTSTAGAAAYSASKGAIVSLTNSLALELAPDGVRVNAVAPGTIRTRMMRDAVEQPDAAAAEAAIDAIGATQPLGRLIEPEEVARLVLFLLSEEASAITGSCHRVDGALLSRLPA